MSSFLRLPVFAQDSDEEYEYYYEDEYEYTDDEDYAYEDETTDYEDTPEEETETEGDVVSEDKPKTVIPLFQEYRLPITVDPENPKLPANHEFKKLRGTIWRGEDRVIKTNDRGQRLPMRVYIFFSEEEDTIAYGYTPYDQIKIPNTPNEKNFIPLNPLLETNFYVPIINESIENTQTPFKENNSIIFQVDPRILRNYEYEKALEMLIQFEKDGTIQTNTFVTTNTNITIVSNMLESNTVDSLKEDKNDEDISNDKAKGTFITESQEEILKKMKSDPNFSIDQLPTERATQDSFEIPTEDFYGEPLGTLKRQSVEIVAQDTATVVDQTAPNQYVVNVGGTKSGIFVAPTGNLSNPYQVIFLSLDQGMNLYEFNTFNSFDVRDDAYATSREARTLYLRMLAEKINMKRYQKVRQRTSYFTNYLN